MDPLAALKILRSKQQAGAQRSEDSDFLESVLDEVIMPCVNNLSNITITPPLKQCQRKLTILLMPPTMHALFNELVLKF